MVRKKAAIFIAAILSINLTACSFNIPSLSESKEVVGAVVQYTKTGKLPDNVREIIAKEYPADTDKTIEAIKEIPERNQVLDMAKHYFDLTYPKIESDVKGEFNRLVTWKPDFSGKDSNPELALKNSGNVAVTISYTDAKNFYLAMACAVFALDPESPNTSGNLASAIATYYDDLLLEGSQDIQDEKRYYSDAIKVYQYALAMGAADGVYDDDCLPILASLGNLYLDTDKFEEAYVCFDKALSINRKYGPARQGMYNYFMAKKQYDRALRMLDDEKIYPVFVKAVAKAGEKQTEISKTEPPTMDQSDEVFEKDMDKLKEVEPLTTGDFLGDIDQNARNKIKGLVDNLQQKMIYTAPEINIISQYSTLRTASAPLGQSALQAFASGISSYVKNSAGQEAKSQLDMLKKYGINVDMGGLDIDDVIANPEKYEDYEPDIKITGIDNVLNVAQNMLKGMEKGIQNPGKNSKEIYRTMAQTQPEYAIFTMNPYEYANHMDILIQRYNITVFNRKYNSYSQYLHKVNMRVTQDIQNIAQNLTAKLEPLGQQAEAEIEKIQNSNMSENEKLLKIHGVHMTYNPQMNNLSDVAWKQATEIACVAYQKKIKKYSEQMYNDCMKHIMLTSDEKVQKNLEQKVKTQVLSGVGMGLQNVLSAYTITDYIEPHDCGCSFEALAAAREAERKERDRLDLEQAQKNKKAKERFEKCEIDENSEYYKKIIKPYEVRINTPFVEGLVGPYKSYIKIKFEIPGVVTLDFGKVEHHLRNTTTFDGGAEIGASGKIGSVGAGTKAFLKFIAVRDSNGNFSAKDVDIIGGGEAGLSLPGVEAKAGAEASAVRGTRSYAEFGVTGDHILDDDLKTAMGNWKPNLSKTLWQGEYKLDN